jgi:hypothetical protein
MTTPLPTSTPDIADLHRLYREIAVYFPAWEMEIEYQEAYFTRPGGAMFRLLWLPTNPQEISFSASEPVHLDAPQECIPHELPCFIMLERTLTAKEIAEMIAQNYLGKYFDNFHAYLTYGDRARVEEWQEEHRQHEAFKEVFAKYPAFAEGFRHHGKRYSLVLERPEYAELTYFSLKGERGMDTVHIEIHDLPLSDAVKIVTEIGASLA